MTTLSTEPIDTVSIQAKLRDFALYWNDRITHWRKTNEHATEKKYAQSFWSDFLKAFDINADRLSLFEREAKRMDTGGDGWIDFFMPSVVIGEAKSLDKTLNPALDQINAYLLGGSIPEHATPKWAIATNFSTFILHRIDGSIPDKIIKIEEIANSYEDFLFLKGKEVITKQEESEANAASAKIMAELYVSMVGHDADTSIGEDAPLTEKDEDESHRNASILMTRLLFLLYGDDSQLWERDLFYRWVDIETNETTLGPQLRMLFEVLNTPVNKRPRNLSSLMARFPYVNGGIFRDLLPLVAFDLPPESRDALLAACRFQWTRISVAVFGSLFQLVKSKEARRAGGEHYTSEKNILKTINPLFLADYRTRADRLIANKTTRQREIDDLLDEMAANIYCDPACGSGNFLILAYARLREIETDLITEKNKRFGTGMGKGSTLNALIELEQRLSIGQFFGFEIAWWPAKIAETAMFLVDHQANLKLAQAVGIAPERLPITTTAHIYHGNALRLAWDTTLPRVDGKTFLFGNPPFIGQSLKDDQQREDLKYAWGEDYGGYLDYVTGWHAKSKDLLASREGEFAYVTTNSIVQGLPVPQLFEPLMREGWHIKFAHRTFAWDSEAPGKAAVHCVIVGFTKDGSARQKLWDYENPTSEPVDIPIRNGINPYLADAIDILVSSEKAPIAKATLPEVEYGTKPADGGFLVAKAGVSIAEGDEIAAKYVRKFIGAKELTQGTYRECLWLEDLDPSDYKASPVLQKRIQGCQDWRKNQKKSGDSYKLKDTPRLMRPGHQPNTSYLAIPRHFSFNRDYFTVDRFSGDVICGDANFLAVDDDGFLFGLISSAMFMTWQRTIGGRIKNDPRFAKKVTWNTFPVPEVSETTRKKVIAAGQNVLAARALHPDRSLADHYEPASMSIELRKAHRNLDRIVDRIFGAKKLLTTEAQRLEYLFVNYIAAKTNSTQD